VTDPGARRPRARSANVVSLRPPEWDWSIWEDGALALEPPLPDEDIQQETPSRWKTPMRSATVPPMASPRPGSVARVRARRTAKEHRAARLLLLGICAIAVLLVLALTAFGSGTPARVETTPASASRLLPGTPAPEIVAAAGTLRIQLPVAQGALTALGYHDGGDGALQLEPLGRQGNEGLLSRLWHRVTGSSEDGLVWYQLGGATGPGTSALDVGAPAGTDVYAPIDGTVVGIRDYVISNRVYGARVDIRPSSATSLVVSLTQLHPDPALTVGSTVAEGTSKVGTIVDLSGVERQALARYTQDAGNNVSLEVHPAATLSIP
jgi:hypothetical protein